MIQAMVSRGYAAVQVEYENSGPGYVLGCYGYRAKAASIFEESANSALGKLCARPRIDCLKGVAVHGYSQGAHIALLGPLYSPLVTAALSFANGVYNWGLFVPVGCMRDSYITNYLPRSKRRYIVGSRDELFGGLWSSAGIRRSAHHAPVATIWLLSSDCWRCYCHQYHHCKRNHLISVLPNTTTTH